MCPSALRNNTSLPSLPSFPWGPLTFPKSLAWFSEDNRTHKWKRSSIKTSSIVSPLGPISSLNGTNEYQSSKFSYFHWSSIPLFLIITGTPFFPVMSDNGSRLYQ